MNSTAYTVQFYYKSSAAPANVGVQVSPDGTANVASTSVTLANTANAWTKVTASVTTLNPTIVSPRYGVGTLRYANNSGGNFDFDDYVIYAGAVDATVPNAPGSVTVGSATSSTLGVSWGAASGGVDGGGYVVVRATSDPTTAPNVNGIYAVGNTVGSGAGSGTMVFIGTATSFTDSGLSASQTYSYRVYTVDKAFNYSSAATGSGTTDGPKTWNGGGADNNWSTTANWADGAAPAVSGSQVIFSGTTRLGPVMNAAYAPGSLTFDNTADAFTLTASGGNSMTLGGTLANNSVNLETLNLPIIISATRTIDTASGNISIGGAISGAGGLTKISGNTLALSGGNSFVGAVQVSGGTLALSGGSALADAATVTLGNTAGVSLSLSSSETIGSLTGGGASGGNVSLGISSTLTFGDATASVTYAGVISDTSSGNLIKQGGGTAVLTGVNTFHGKTTINAGQVNISADSALGTAPGAAVTDQLNLDNNGTLRATASVSMPAARGITLGSGGGKLSTSALTSILTINGNITGAGGLNFTSGSLSLFGNNDFVGDLTISGSSGNSVSLRLDSNTAAGVGKIQVSQASGTIGVTLRGFDGVTSVTVPNDIVLNSSASSVNLDANDSSSSITFSGPISSTVSVPVTIGGNANGGGTITLSGNNSGWSGGANASRGTLKLGHKSALGTGTLTIAPATSNPQAVGLQATTTLTGANAVANTVSINTAGSAPHLTFGGASALELSGSISLTTASPTIANNNTAATILSGNIGGTGFGITFSGSGGTLTLKGANTYDGGTIIGSGTVLVNNTSGSGTGSGTVTVLTGATLGGTGTISGVMTNNLGGTIAPGDSIGTITFNSAPSFSGTNAMEINKSGVTYTADKISVTSGTLAYGGKLTVTELGGSATLSGGETFDLFDSTSGFNSGSSFTTLNLPTLPIQTPTLNWFTGNLTVDGTIKVNRAPVASGNTIVRHGGTNSVKVAVSTLLGNDTDADLDTLTISAVSPASTGGLATVTNVGAYVFYTPTSAINVSDSFTYTVSDGRGGTGTGTVTVNISAVEQVRELNLSTVTNGFQGSFYGILSASYTVQYSTNLTIWDALTNVTTSTNGLGLFTDPGPVEPQRYYRIVYP